MLCGGLVGNQVGPEPVEWVLWPVEVYASGAVLRVRLPPLGPGWEYDDASGALVCTVVPPAAGPNTTTRSCSPPPRPARCSGPTSGCLCRVDPGHGDRVWSHPWTLEFWWPR